MANVARKRKQTKRLALYVEKLLAESWAEHKRVEGEHPFQRNCPGCGKDAMRVAMVNLVYRYVTCECSIAPYTHLVEQLWHGECYGPEPKRKDGGDVG